jgi:hypothetical protein
MLGIYIHVLLTSFLRALKWYTHLLVSKNKTSRQIVRLDSLHNFQLLDPFFFRNFGMTTYCGHWSVPSGVWRGHGLGDVPGEHLRL